MAELDTVEQVVIVALFILYAVVVYYAYDTLKKDKDDFNKGEGKL